MPEGIPFRFAFSKVAVTVLLGLFCAALANALRIL